MKVKFHKNALYRYGQDHGFFCGPLPSDVEFTVTPLNSEKLRLVGPGFGVIGNYGNGAIYMTNKNFIAAISAEIVKDE